MDDIPVALRERKKTDKSSVSTNSVLSLLSLFGVGLMALLFVTLTIFNLRLPIRNSDISNASNVEKNPDLNQESSQQTETNNQNTSKTDLISETENNGATEVQSNSNSLEPENILGHLPYQEVVASELKAITNDGRIKLRTSAANKFKQMQAAARASGIILVPLSGFRSISEQEYLFFQVKAQRAQVASKRAEVSAPPGYSEHHTGYAVDIGDGRVPAANLSANFEQTSAYKWLIENAPKYSFELSFTPDNLQGISYEPWHWRYVGDSHSLETFYKARNLKSKIN